MAKTRNKSSKSIIRTRSFALRGKNGKETGVFTGNQPRQETLNRLMDINAD